jgi:hypothetical protein
MGVGRGQEGYMERGEKGSFLFTALIWDISPAI